MKWILIFIAIGLVVGSIIFFSFLITPPVADAPTQTQDQLVIGFSMATFRDERWVKDRDFFVQKVEELGAKAVVFEADGDAALQAKQVENLILQGVDVLVMIPEDAVKSAALVDKAHAAGIKVIAYDRLIKNPALDYYVSFDSVKVGEAEAQAVVAEVPAGKFAYVGGSETDTNAFLVREGSFSVLQPLIDAQEIQLVYDEFTPDWKQENAYMSMKAFLKNGGTVDAVVAANDTTAAGVIQALKEVGLAGKIPVSGQDASLGAIQYIVQGFQTVSVYKPIKDLAYKSAEIAVAVASGKEVVTNSVITNGSVQTPAYLLDVVPVTKDNLDETVIKDGFHSSFEVYGE